MAEKRKGRPAKPHMMYFGARMDRSIVDFIRSYCKTHKVPVGSFLKQAVMAYMVGRSKTRDAG